MLHNLLSCLGDDVLYFLIKSERKSTELSLIAQKQLNSGKRKYVGSILGYLGETPHTKLWIGSIFFSSPFLSCAT